MANICDLICNKMSYLVRARPEEECFLLLARDAAAPMAIRCWVDERIDRGLNEEDDEQIREARMIARRMEGQRESIRAKLK